MRNHRHRQPQQRGLALAAINCHNLSDCCSGLLQNVKKTLVEQLLSPIVIHPNCRENGRNLPKTARSTRVRSGHLAGCD